MLSEADLLVGHNIIEFDLPALKKVYPGWETKALVRDTIVLSRLMWPHVKEDDFARAKAGKLPTRLIGSHSLEAYGYRMGEYKGDYKGGWENWSPEMQEYMDQDVTVTVTLWRRCEKEAAEWGVPIEDPYPPAGKDCVELEHRVAEIVRLVQQHGWKFNEEKAAALTAKITARKVEVEAELQRAFPPLVTEFIPKASNSKYGYVKGIPIKRTTPFNPGSRQQVGKRLMGLGWKPSAFGADGHPTVDEETLTSLPYPEAKLLSEYFMLEKRLGQIANGKEAWLKHVRKGRIHGRITSGGAHTGRMTHSKPNVAQVPANGAPYGEECRALFEADTGYVLVGCDADGLELRDLAGYMARFDKGAYIETVLRGDKAKGTDMHTINAKAILAARDVAKVFFYAMIYGSGDPNLGNILGVVGKRASSAGAQARAALMRAVPALKKLVDAVGNAVDKRGYITGLDGRRLRARAKNAALNTLLQSAGAVQMKRALVILYDALTGSLQWQFGREFAIVGLIHDEWQASVMPQYANDYGRLAVSAIRDAGSYYSFRCPLDGQYEKGQTWAETH